MRSYFVKTFVFVLFVSVGITHAQSTGTDTVIVLPFENRSGKAEFNWVGESFAGALTELLRVPSLTVVSNDERKIMQQRLRIPLSTLPSLATSLKLAHDSNATMLVSGRYEIMAASAESAATINVTVRVVRVQEGRFMSEEMSDGRRITRDINLTDALGNLQTIHGQIAYQILYQRDKALPFSQNDLIGQANKVPARAFEAYIKGLLTVEPQARENFLKNAARLYADASDGGIYPEANLELGHLYISQRKSNDAVMSFERVISANRNCRDAAKAANRPPLQCRDEAYAEASFYTGVMFWQQNNFESALAALRPLTDDLKLTSVYNTLGAVAIQASRAETKNPGRAAGLLNEGSEHLKRAVESAPEDGTVHFNYGVSLFLAGNFAPATEAFRAAIAANPRDGESYFLLARSLESLKDESAATIDSEARRLLADSNRYANLQTEWTRSKSIPTINLRVEQPARKDFVAVVLSRKPENAAPKMNETDTLLATARAQVKAGTDDEAMVTLRRILASEPMSAESYLLLGKIHLRRGDIDQAISSFKTAIFWDNRMLEAHISLGRIYVDRSDCLQAKNYAASAREIAADDPDTAALQRMTERCAK